MVSNEISSSCSMTSLALFICGRDDERSVKKEPYTPETVTCLTLTIVLRGIEISDRDAMR